MIKIQPEEIVPITQYIHSISGIYYDHKKAYLLESRLEPLLEDLGLSSYMELYQMSRADPKKEIEKKIIDAISTNETFFFRDTGPFNLLKHKIIPDLIKARSEKNDGFKIPLRIWSAACSTGQEVYSIAIILKEVLREIEKYNIILVGTDISDAALARARSGEYNRFEIERGLTRERLQRFFTRHGDTWKIKDDIRKMVTFKKQNLMLSFKGLGNFDIIFCRNVTIYFSGADRKKVFNNVADMLAPDGYLIVGSTESLTSVCPRFVPEKFMGNIYYRLK